MNSLKTSEIKILTLQRKLEKFRSIKGLFARTFCVNHAKNHLILNNRGKTVEIHNFEKSQQLIINLEIRHGFKIRGVKWLGGEKIIIFLNNSKKIKFLVVEYNFKKMEYDLILSQSYKNKLLSKLIFATYNLDRKKNIIGIYVEFWSKESKNLEMSHELVFFKFDVGWDFCEIESRVELKSGISHFIISSIFDGYGVFSVSYDGIMSLIQSDGTILWKKNSGLTIVNRVVRVGREFFTVGYLWDEGCLNIIRC